MHKFRQGLAWTGDMFKILIASRFDPVQKRDSQMCSTACRTLRFRAHCKIPQIKWDVLLESIGLEDVGPVTLPGPATELGDVGDQTAYHAIATLIRALQPQNVLEIGTYLGVSAYTMALNAPSDCRIFTVDLPEETHAAPESRLNDIDQTHVLKSRHRVGEAFLRSPLRSKITQIRADSLTFEAEEHLTHADFVYVDGGHSTICVTKDTENAFRVLAPDGTIVWDDYFHLYPDVVEFLDGLNREYPLHRIAGTNFVLYSRRWKQPIR